MLLLELGCILLCKYRRKYKFQFERPKEAIQKIRTDNLGKSMTKTSKVTTISNPHWNQKHYQFGYELCNCS